MRQSIQNLLGYIREEDIPSFSSKFNLFLKGAGFLKENPGSARASAACGVVHKIVSNKLLSEQVENALLSVLDKHFSSGDVHRRYDEDLTNELERLLFRLSTDGELVKEYLDFAVSAGVNLNERKYGPEDSPWPFPGSFPAAILANGPLDPEILEHAVHLGFDIDIKTPNGRTLCKNAARYGRLTPSLLDIFSQCGIPMAIVEWEKHIQLGIEKIKEQGYPAGAECLYPMDAAEWFHDKKISIAKNDSVFGKEAINSRAYASFLSWARYAEKEALLDLFDEREYDHLAFTVGWDSSDMSAAAVVLLYSGYPIPAEVKKACENFRDEWHPSWACELFRSREIWDGNELWGMPPVRFFEAVSALEPWSLEGKLSEETIQGIADAIRKLGEMIETGNANSRDVKEFLSELCARVLGTEAGVDEECGGEGPVL